MIQRMIIYLFMVQLVMSAPMAPMGPLAQLMDNQSQKSDQEKLIESGIEHEKLAAYSVQDGIKALTDFEAQQLNAVATQMSGLADAGLQSQKLIADTAAKQLVGGFQQQQQFLTAGIQAEKMAMDAFNQQMLTGVNTVLVVPRAIMATVAQPMSNLQTLQSMVSLGNQQAPMGTGGLIPLISSFDKMMTAPLVLLNPFLAMMPNPGSAPNPFLQNQSQTKS